MRFNSPRYGGALRLDWARMGALLEHARKTLSLCNTTTNQRALIRHGAPSF
jgi:hypothetical protein